MIVYKCYKFGNLGHISFEYHENEKVGQRYAYVPQPKAAEAQTPMAENVPEMIESLMMKNSC